MEAYVIGTSPYINKIDLSQLDGKETFGLNHLPLKYKSKYLVITDSQFYKENTEMIKNFSGERIFMSNIVLQSNELIKDTVPVTIIQWAKQTVGFSTHPSQGFCDGRNVGVAACQVAHWMKLSPIYLLGSEMNYELPYFDQSLTKQRSGFAAKLHFEDTESCYRFGLAKGVKIISCMPNSRLNGVLKFEPGIIKYEE